MSTPTPFPTSNTVNLTVADLTTTPAEAAVIGVTAFIQLINVLVLIYVIINRNYPPLKIKQIPIVSGNLLSGIIWWLGALASSRMLPWVDSQVFLACDFWFVWVQEIFGVFIWVSLLLLRLWRLYSIVGIRAPFFRTTKGIVTAFAVLWVPTSIYGIVCSALRLTGPIYVNEVYMCKWNLPALYFGVAILLIYSFGFVFFSVVLRRIKQKYLNEYRETIVSFAACFITYFVYLVILVLALHTQVWGRSICAAIVTFIPSFVFYLTIGRPALMCMIRPEEFEKEFLTMVKNANTTSQTREKVSMTGGSVSKIDGGLSGSHIEVEESQVQA